MNSMMRALKRAGLRRRRVGKNDQGRRNRLNLLPSSALGLYSEYTISSYVQVFLLEEETACLLVSSRALPSLDAR